MGKRDKRIGEEGRKVPTDKSEYRKERKRERDRKAREKKRTCMHVCLRRNKEASHIKRLLGQKIKECQRLAWWSPALSSLALISLYIPRNMLDLCLTGYYKLPLELWLTGYYRLPLELCLTGY